MLPAAPGLAPVMPPVMVPIVQEKLLGVDAVNERFIVAPLQVDVLAALVTTGFGYTVAVMVNGVPTQPPVVAVGVTIYCTVPVLVALGLVSTLLMVLPEPAAAPVMLPVIVPIVQVNVLAVLAVSAMLAAEPLHTEAVGELVTVGFGFTVTVIV